MSEKRGFFSKLDSSLSLTVIGIVLLFSISIAVILIAPRHIDPSWTEPSSDYQVQMYEVSDPHLYISQSSSYGDELTFVYHLKNDYTLLAFKEGPNLRILAPQELKKYVTYNGDKELKLTSRLLMLREPKDLLQEAMRLVAEAKEEWKNKNPNWLEENKTFISYNVLELYDPLAEEAFAIAPTDGILENWVDERFQILDSHSKQSYHEDSGVIYVKNPQEFKYQKTYFEGFSGWEYSSDGESIASLDALKQEPFKFMSRKELIEMGEQIYAREGCWYCHTDQTRTLVQDLVLNGSESEPAPPSSPNEYIYQNITFPGTQRIGPDLSRVGVKRQSRDWHKSHFWSPKTESPGSIMPSFRFFFDFDPRGTAKNPYGVPNYEFEAIFQYLMTKGTRITSPNQAWWLGRDPIQTKKIINGEKRS